mmetsp:Transcript_26342/g.61383  ORF Transcript_26342/g.61383 Transcript_26342/m.61383 type:complete len:90 (-) Transcript_26342:217-486(-)
MGSQTGIQGGRRNAFDIHGLEIHKILISFRHHNLSAAWQVLRQVLLVSTISATPSEAHWTVMYPTKPVGHGTVAKEPPGRAGEAMDWDL